MAKVIGEGTYGCVHKPQLYCNNSTSRKRGKISKLLKEDDAEKELKEYKIMKDIDPKDNYYLGEPESCFADDKEYNKKSLKDCDNLHKHDENLMNNLKKYKLIIMEDGGDNLKAFSKSMKKMEKNEENKKIMEKFWIEAHRIFVGLKLFLDNDVVHHDLNNNNIVFNKIKNRINFIDFGLMRKRSKLIEDSKKSKNGFSIYHWSFPPDCRFLNKSIYDKVNRVEQSKRTAYYEDIMKLNEKKVDSKAFSEAITSFLYFVADDGDFLNQKVILDNILKGFGNTFLNQIKKDGNHYRDYVEKCVNTIDLYGVGLAFLCVLRTTHQLIDSGLATDLKDLFLRMVDADLAARIDVEDAIRRYETILTSHGLMDKYSMNFDYNIKVEKDKMKRRTVIDMNKIKKSVNKASLKQSIKEMGEKIEKDENILEAELKKQCPEGKELNPKTNRCIKLCPNGYIRDENFKCKKTLKKKMSLKVVADIGVIKKCSPEKELNPLTNRCVKRCPEGLYRNEKFHCRKNKTFKIRRPRI